MNENLITERAPQPAVQPTFNPSAARLTAVPSAPDAPSASSIPMWFELHETHDGESVRLRTTGELDLAAAPILMRRLAQLHAERRPVCLDLSELEFMDSSGIYVLIRALNDARADGWQLSIDPVLSQQVQRLFVLAGLDRILSAA